MDISEDGVDDGHIQVEVPEAHQYWIDDPDLLHGEVKLLDNEDATFFEGLIEKYLKPLDQDKDREKRVALELKELKNKTSFAFLLLNAIYIVVVFTLQIQRNESGLTIPWPCGRNLSLEPIGIIFLAIFAFVMTLQIAGMLIHRIGTFLHIMALTKLHRQRKKPKLSLHRVLELARKLGRVREDESDEERKEIEKKMKRKSVIRKRSSSGKRFERTIRGQFTKRWKNVQEAQDDVSDEQLTKNLYGDATSRRAMMRRTQTINKCRQLNRGDHNNVRRPNDGRRIQMDRL